MTRSFAARVLPTVNASYRQQVTARELAAKIADPASADTCDAAAFAFFSEIAPELQLGFIEEQKVDPAAAEAVRRRLFAKAGYQID